MLRRTPLIFLALLAAVSPSATAATVATAGKASIVTNERAGTWTISAGGATLTLAIAASRDFEVVSLGTSSNISWVAGKTDTSITINGNALAFGSRAAGFVFENVTTSTRDQTLTLDAVFELPKAGLRVTRHYRATSGSPTFETWTTYAPTGNPVTVSDLNAFTLTVPNGTVHWITGLLGDSSVTTVSGAFTRQEKQVSEHEEFVLGSDGRSSEQAVPWLTVDGDRNEEFFAALMWSGAWRLTAYRPATTLELTLGLAPMTTSIHQEIEGPHAVFGVVRGGLAQATAALRSYFIDGLRGGRPLTPLITYNTWFAYATSFDEHDMMREMDSAAAMGAELFVVDAGWYAGAGANGRWDFDSGLGSWEADPARFPNGLAGLKEYAHSVGLEFGLWVEPERIDLALLGGASGVDESWLATSAGDRGSNRTGLICFANAAARARILSQLTALVDAIGPDYLKWDNNMWVNCDRAGHDHGTDDGNFAQVTGLYDVLSQLRARYPDMLIENVSGGGNRLDLGMLRYTDVAWMDDRTSPSVHVRHNVQGLSAVFPPAYLLSFVTPHDTEPLHRAPDMSLYFRSRMEGALGLCFKAGGLTDDDLNEMTNEIEVYKSIRGTLSVAAGVLLTDQAAVEGGPDWDVLQEATSDGGQALLWAVQANDGVATVTVKPAGLDATKTYDVSSVDLGTLGSATGADLMENGIELVGSPATAAHILVLTAR
jgi:alpha-galactosidase